MPPSGFDIESIAPLLEVIQDFYQVCKQDGDEAVYLEEKKNQLLHQAESKKDIPLSLNGVQSLRKFFSEILQDILDEIESGKKTPGKAVEQEIEDISRFLSQFTIEES